MTFSKMERSVTCIPGISLAFYVSLPWKALKVTVFSLLSIKPEFPVRKKAFLWAKSKELQLYL